MQQLKYLGHIVSKDGVTTDPEKIKALLSWPLPKTVTQLRSFMGFANYYRKFVKNYSEKSHKLEKLLQNSSYKKTLKQDSREIIWKDDDINAFQSLKDSLCSTPCLAFPDRSKTFILDTDAQIMQ